MSNITHVSEIWAAVPNDQWYQALVQLDPVGKWGRKGRHIKGCCPWHADRSPSFYITPDKGLAKCFACNKVVTDPVELLAKVGGSSYAVAMSTIVEGQWGIKVNTRLAAAIRAEQEEQTVRLALVSAMRRTLYEGMRNVHQEEWAYVAPAVAFLLRRGAHLTEDSLARLPIGVMPTKQHLSRFILDRGLFERAMQLAGGHFWFTDPTAKHGFTGAVAFFYGDAPGRWSAIKLRHPEQKDFLFIGQGASPRRGVFGLDLCTGRITLDDAQATPVDGAAVLVEGELDCLMAHQAEGAVPSVAWLGISGNGMDLDFTYLTRCGFHRLAMVPDNDRGGVAVTRQLLEAAPGEVRIFTPPPTVWGAAKDVDDIVQAGTYRGFVAALQQTEHWSGRSDWVAAQMHEQLAAQPAFSVAAQEELCALWLRCFPQGGEAMSTHRQRVYEALAQGGLFDQGIAAAYFRDGRDAGEFLLSLRAALERMICPLYTDGANVVTCYSMASESAFSLDYGGPASKRLAALKLHGLPRGTTLETWVNREVGIPAWFRYKSSSADGEAVPIDPLVFNKKLNEHVDLALEVIMSKDVPDAHGVTLAYAGVHYYGWDGDARLRSKELEHYLYVVNAGQAYAGRIMHDHVVWSEVTVPVHNTITFVSRTSGVGDIFPRWTDNIRSVDDLRRAPDHTPSELFAVLKRIVKAGWVFADSGEATEEVQELESTYLAAVIMTSGCVALFPRRNQTFLTAERSSGKSKFMALCSRRDPTFGLVEQGQYYEDFTVAGVSQAVKHRKPFLCVDEFETTGQGQADENRARHARGLLEAMRNNYTGHGAAIRGRPDGEAQLREFSAGVLLAGIHPLTNDADITRFVFVALKHVDKMVESPEDRIQKVVDMREWPRIRRSVTMFGLYYAPQILEAVHYIQELSRTLSTGGIEHANRFNDIMLPVYTVLHVAGVDVPAFAARYAPLKARNFKQLAPENKGQLLRRIATTPVRNSLPDGVGKTLAQLAAVPQHHPLLVQHGLGLYVVPAREKGGTTSVAVCYIPQLIDSVLHQHGYKQAAAATIYRELSSNPAAWSTARASAAGVPRAMQALLRFTQLDSNSWVAFPLDTFVGGDDSVSAPVVAPARPVF